MSVTTTPAPARSDVAAPVGERSRSAVHPYRRHGLVLTAGALAWSSMIAVFGFDQDTPSGEATHSAAQYGHNAGAFLFQVGVLALLRALWLSNALGTGRLARVVLRAEACVLALAMASTTSDFLGVTNMENLVSFALDMCWPLSMLGMFLIGIRIAVAGRWRGLARFYPMVAESWAVVTVPTMGIFGSGVARWVGAAHLLVGYAVLGRLVSRKRGDTD